MMTMSKERPGRNELDPAVVAGFAATFLSRGDYYPMQKKSGGYFVVEKPLHVGVVMAHLKGVMTIGAYTLSPASEAKCLVFDADTDEQWSALVDLGLELNVQGVTPYLEPSRRGGHLWLFTDPMRGTAIRRLGRQLLTEHGIDQVEMFPKQDALSTGPGSLVRLPLGVHQITERRYPFVTLTGEWLAPTVRAQVKMLANPARVPQTFIREVLRRVPKDELPPLPRFTKQDIRDGLPSQKIKEAVPLEQFVAQYVKLDSRGRGHCPFHDDAHMSFQVGVGKLGPFWSCYAACGEPHGGDIIHFWQRMRQKNGQDDGFVATITELAGMVLK